MSSSDEEQESLDEGERRMKKLASNLTFKKLRSWHPPLTSCQVDGEKMETVASFIFLGSKITVDSDCSHKIKRCLLLERNL